ncbi:hypothetical protein N7452_003200 [Penicillium brevicompactum]|uniref:C2H2-type domain-containing protein n=1 Tax=Penicillium brevicompactum TaxID=5074 RepID=A0A9W9QT49_PENBR|nr:hypothetical protein N7452_003200 [Penicillium brevicompactum]
MPTPNETKHVSKDTPLDRAIAQSSDSVIRATLKSVCAQNEEARKIIESQLLVMSTDAPKGSNLPKTPVPRYAICVSCEKEFDVTLNTEKSCQYHPAEPEGTGSDIEVDNYGEFELEPEDLQEDFPECFTFECCGGNMRDDPDGCVVDFHREEVSNKPTKRARVN